MIEITSKRSFMRKEFDSGLSTRGIVRHFAAPVHYFNKLLVGDGVMRFREIDNTITLNIATGRFEILFNNFVAAIPLTADGNFFYRDIYQGKDQTIAFRARGVNPVNGVLMNDGAIPDIGASYVIYPDAYGTGTDLIIGTRLNSLVKLVRIRAGFYPVADVNFDFAFKFPDSVNGYAAVNWKNAAQGTQVIAAGTADTTAMGQMAAFQSLYIGNDQGDGSNWFSIIRPPKMWDSTPLIYTAPNTATEPKRLNLPWKWAFDSTANVLVLRKSIPASFFVGATGDVYTDSIIDHTDTSDSFYGTSFLTSGNGSATTLHIGGWGDQYLFFIQFDLTGAPAAANVITAILNVWSVNGATLSPVPNTKRITSSWSEATLSSTVNPTVDSTVFTWAGSWPNSSSVWQTCDITSIYKLWLQGTSNFGVRTEPTVNNPTNSDSQIASREYTTDTTKVPYLEATYVKPQYGYRKVNKLRPRIFAPGIAR